MNDMTNFIRTSSKRIFLLICVMFIYHSQTIYGNDYPDVVRDSGIKALNASIDKKVTAGQFTPKTITYYLNISDFINSLIEIPTSIIGTTTISSLYIAGRAPIYNSANNLQVGTCSASFLCMQTPDGIFTDISNYLSADSGLIVSWFTPTTLINLELDSIINSMVTDCTVTASTKIGVNPFFNQTFNLIVSSDGQKITFQFTRTGTVF